LAPQKSCAKKTHHQLNFCPAPVAVVRGGGCTKDSSTLFTTKTNDWAGEKKNHPKKQSQTFVTIQ